MCRVGNSDFQRAHSFLVGLSYRAVYRFDPFIDKPKPRLGLSLQLQAVGSELFFDGRTAQQLRVPLRWVWICECRCVDGWVGGWLGIRALQAAESCRAVFRRPQHAAAAGATQVGGRWVVGRSGLGGDVSALRGVGSEPFFDGRTAQQLQVPLRWVGGWVDGRVDGWVGS